MVLVAIHEGFPREIWGVASSGRTICSTSKESAKLFSLESFLLYSILICAGAQNNFIYILWGYQWGEAALTIKAEE